MIQHILSLFYTTDVCDNRVNIKFVSSDLNISPKRESCI